MIPTSKLGLKFFPGCFRRHVYLKDLSIVVMRDILQSRYLRRRVAHKQLARTSLSSLKRPDLDDGRRDCSPGVDFILSQVLDNCSTRTADSEEEKYQPLYHVPQTPLTQLNRIELNISE